ncbi:MAG: PilZ domain-containing protein [Aestuariivirga sp.]|uniref:PilZ domain-containing protein n=1 Tax=Aestuariivirga sp. TaxID=2650926 RepID=UPI0038D0AB8A
MGVGISLKNGLEGTQAFSQRRRADRRDCNLDATITTRHGEIRARVHNLSAGGVGFSIDPVISLKPGDVFTLRHEKLGDVACVVRWAMQSRHGAEFTETGAPLAGVHAFYDTLPSGHNKAV